MSRNITKILALFNWFSPSETLYFALKDDVFRNVLEKNTLRIFDIFYRYS